MSIDIYVLELEENKYYIGQAKDVQNRFDQHLKAKLSSEWTKKYKPLRIVEVIKTNFTEISEAMYTENLITVQYMKKFGWENVRGGDYCTLNSEKLRFLLSVNTDLGSKLIPIKNPNNYFLNKTGYFFFVLLLQEGNYFIGKSKNITLAILNEFNGLGSEWTKIYKPLELVNIIEIIDTDKEIIRKKHNDLVIYFMKKNDFSKIRGGDFFNIDQRNHKNKVLNYTDIFK